MSLFLIFVIFFAALTVVGFFGVHKTGNYENKWGYMLIWGAVLFVLSMFLGFGLFLIALF